MVAGKVILTGSETLGRAIFLDLLSQLWLTFDRPEDERAACGTVEARAAALRRIGAAAG